MRSTIGFAGTRRCQAGAELEFDGLATLAEIWLDGTLVAHSRNMFLPLTVPVPSVGAERLEICFRALRPSLRQRHPGPRARWKGRLTTSESLRGIRTTLLGHMPGWSGEAAVIGPYRPVILHRLASDMPRFHHPDLRSRLKPDGTGVVELMLPGDGLLGRTGTLRVGNHTASLVPMPGGLQAALRIPDPPRWWPHTHGAPATLPVTVEIGGHRLDLGAIGFRTVERRDRADGFGLIVNGIPIFCRGAIWAGLDPRAGPDDPDTLRSTLELAREAGFNMIRVSGLTTYATSDLLALCDELGLLVWHDFMFARFDYPEDEAFLADAAAETRAFLVRAQAHPSVAVLCGGTENAQAAAMSGSPQDTWCMPLFDQVLAREAASLRPDVPYVPQAPLAAEGGLPFAAAADIAHYFGAGAYQRPLDDLETAGVRFAAECLAFANIPEPATCRGDADRRAPAPRDIGADWDFGDARDHYARALLDPSADDPAEAGRVAVAMVMQHALSVWRSDGRCAGALVLMLRDIVSGPGWGLIAHDGQPKSAWYALKSACQPIQLFLRDLGQNGVVVHLVNETADTRPVRLRLRGLTPDGTAETLGETTLTLSPRRRVTVAATELMGRWRDLANAWRFGPPAFAALGATLEELDGTRLSEGTVFPSGAAWSRNETQMTVRLAHDKLRQDVEIWTRGFARSVQIDDDNCIPADNYFHLWPGERRVVALRPRAESGGRAGGIVTALNATRPVHYGLAA